MMVEGVGEGRKDRGVVIGGIRVRMSKKKKGTGQNWS